MMSHVITSENCNDLAGYGLYYLARLGLRFIGGENSVVKRIVKWFNSNTYSRAKITGGLCIPEDSNISGKISEENGRLFKEYNVMGSPTFFINGYKVPPQYEIDDIRFLREVFKEKNEVNIKVNAVN